MTPWRLEHLHPLASPALGLGLEQDAGIGQHEPSGIQREAVPLVSPEAVALTPLRGRELI